MFLPTTIKEVRARGWEQLDVILFSGDAYIDHPAFGAAVIGRLLEAEGYRVAIVPQPNWRDDLRDFRKLYGVECADIARRLMDYGFHAPTLSFPVHETLMIEPTESESLAELDRFVESLVAIKRECEQIRDGEADAEDNPVKMAPHTAQEACADTWTHPYGRERAVFPLPWIRANKFFPYVTKIDGGYGDRNLCCTCGTLYGGE